MLDTPTRTEGSAYRFSQENMKMSLHIFSGLYSNTAGAPHFRKGGSGEMSAAVWSFTLDEDDLVIAEGPAGTEENVRLAFETFILPFGTRAESAETYLREWRTMEKGWASGYTLGSPSATVRRIDPEQVEVGDLYGQFETCTMSAAEFVGALEDLVRFLRQLRS
ncbi:hypothetical protein ABT389_07745 [Streptomyces bacillaris]|uniref:hypothetical protein n=1 Tax=Streptomyces bacillaris TaxID=68179 RepID=UPI00334A472D